MLGAVSGMVFGRLTRVIAAECAATDAPDRCFVTEPAD
jgi:hypothetical protein